MSKELEVFEKILDILCCQKHDDKLQDYIDMVENALERLDIYESNNFVVVSVDETNWQVVAQDTNFIKKLQALEIIKKFPQKVVFLCNSNSYEECLEMMNAFEVAFDFPKQEYDLLKEVLL